MSAEVSHPTSGVYAQSPQETLDLAIDYFGREAAKNYFADVIMSLREANDIFTLPRGPMERFAVRFALEEEAYTYGACYDFQERSIEYAVAVKRPSTLRHIRPQTMHEFSHGLFWENCWLRDKTYPNETIQGVTMDEGIAYLAESQYANKPKPPVTRFVKKEAHKILHWSQYTHRSPILSVEDRKRYLRAQQPVRNVGYVVGHYIASSISDKYSLEAKELAEFSVPELVTMGRKSI